MNSGGLWYMNFHGEFSGKGGARMVDITVTINVVFN